MRPHDLVPCLQCVDCENTLDQPVTLYCGHSICARHLPISLPPACPLAACSPGPIPQRNARDVTLTNILDLVNSHSRHPFHGDDDPPPDSPGADERPRKRQKRAQSDEEDEEGDLLSHLRSIAANERLIPADVPLIPTSSSDTSSAELVLILEGKLIEELTCSTCTQLLYEPLTTPCQHTFCTRCVLRCADEQACCPLCRASLPSYSYLDRPPSNRCLTATLLRACPKLYQDRMRTTQAEERRGRARMPIVQGPLCLPGMPEEVQLTGSKYRLMLRRCFEQQDPVFGLIMTPRNGDGGAYGAYGTLVHVVGVEALSNVSVNVRFWGHRRFRIVGTGFLDGYEVARLAMIDDYSDDLAAIHLINDGDEVEVGGNAGDNDNGGDNESEEQSRAIAEEASSASAQPSGSSSNLNTGPRRGATSVTTAQGNTTPPSNSTPEQISPAPPRAHASQPGNEELMEYCREFIGHLRAGRTPWVSPNYAQLPEMPTDLAMFTFWVAHSLPLPPEEVSKLLPIRSPRMRLLLVSHWIQGLNEKWWWRAGCVVC